MQIHSWFWPVLITAYGACVGSFLNVVIYRLPEGLSLVWPPSRCPGCGHKLAFYDNVPVLGWLWLGGKCRYCRAGISIQYPLIEAATAALFGGLYWVYYHSGWRPDFQALGLADTWPLFLVHLVLVGGLVAATVIDAKLYIIPIGIPHTVALVSLLVLPLAVTWVSGVGQLGPVVNPAWVLPGVGGLMGLALAVALVHLKLLPRSFDDEQDLPDDAVTPEQYIEHPHVRREVAKEVLFLIPPALGVLIGYGLVPDADTALGKVTYSIQACLVGGITWGFLIGGAIIWITRILGTFGFGKEAMGLGDVHLLAGIGAVMGARDTVIIFFVAPFLGLVGAALHLGLTRILKGQRRVIPYGPSLAAATLIVMVARGALPRFFDIFQQ